MRTAGVFREALEQEASASRSYFELDGTVRADERARIDGPLLGQAWSVRVRIRFRGFRER